MRGPYHRLRRGVAVFLVLSALAAPFLASVAAAYGERVYESNTVVPIGDPSFQVWSGNSVAQSFTTTQTYVLLNVTLRLRNIGTGGNTINITIRPDFSGVPSSSVLAWANPLAPGTVGPVDVPLTPTPTLTRGVLYWIVATNPRPLTMAYEWHHSNGNTYAGGKAMQNDGTGWANPLTPTDMWFLNYGRELDANVTTAMTASTSRALPKDTVLFTVYMNNSGTQAAKTVWLNDTLPSGFTYISDTAGSIPANTGYPNYTFTKLGNGAHSFTITARVRVDVAPGSTLTNVASLVYTNATGTLRPSRAAQATVVIGLQWKQLYLVPPTPPGPPYALVPTPPTGTQVAPRLQHGGTPADFPQAVALSRAFRIVNVTPVLYLDSNSHGVKSLDMNFTLLDVNGATQTPIWYGQMRVTTDNVNGFQRFPFPFPETNLTLAAGHQILLRIACMSTSNDDALLAMNAAATPSQVDFLTSTYVHVDALGLRDANGPASLWSPMDRIVVRANVSDPFGAAEIAGASINITDPSGALVRNFTAMTLLSSGSSWKLFNASLGPTLANGTYGIEVIVKENNGAIAYAVANALVRSPDVRPVIVSTQASALSGDTFFYTVWYNNSGTGRATRVWVNLTLPSQLIFVTSSAEANRTGPTNWTFMNVGVGSPSFIVQVSVRSGIPPVSSMTTTVALNATDEKGYHWPVRTAATSVILQGPVFSFVYALSRTTIHSNETLVLSSTLRNTGDLAGTVWLNLTWSAGLAYVSDTAASVGGTSTVRASGVDIRWTNLAAGPAFAVAVTVNTGSGLPRGLNLTTAAGLAYTNARGAIMPNQAVARSAKVIAPAIVNATISLTRLTATPGDVVPARVSFENVGDEAALSLVVTISLDPSLSFVPSPNATISGSAALFVFSNVGVGTKWIFLNLTVSRLAADRAVLSVQGAVVYTDRVANPMPAISAGAVSVTVAAPVLRLTGSPAVTNVEAGTLVVYRVDPSNLGTGAAKDVWLNATLPLDLLYVSDSSDGFRSGAGARITWYWSAFNLGSRAFNVTLAVRGAAVDGASEDIILEANYTDGNGNVRAAVGTALRASVVAPRLLLTLEASVATSATQASFQYTIHVRNAGTTIARTVWVMDSVDEGLKVVSYASSVAADGDRNVKNWTYHDLQPNEEQVIVLNVQILSAVAVGTRIPNFITAVFTNSEGQVIGASQSNPVVVTVTEAASPLPYIGAAVAAVGGLLGFVVYRRRTSRIEEVFLVTKQGILIDHLSRNLVGDKDPDIVGGMLTGIQTFVRDAFKFGAGGDLHQMEFGDSHVLIERGKDVYIAAVTSGGDPQMIAAKLRKALAQIEEEFGEILANFDGSMDKVLGVRERLRERLLN